MTDNEATKRRFLKGFTWLIAGLSAVLIIGGLLASIGWVTTGIWRGLDKFLTKMTEIFSYAAVLLIVLRMIWTGVHKLRVPYLRWTRTTWLFFKQRHVLFGWIVAAAGTAHSLYFLIFLPKNMNGVFSGLLAFVIMAVMVFFGYKLDHKARTSKSVRTAHTILGIFFFIALMYHLVDSH